MRIYAIRIDMDYGEYVQVVCAKSKRQAEKMVKLDYNNSKIAEVKLIKMTKEPQTLFYGGSVE